MKVTQLFTASHWAHYKACFGFKTLTNNPRQGEIVLDESDSNDVRYSAWSVWTGECVHCHSLSGAQFLLAIVAARFPVGATPAWHKAAEHDALKQAPSAVAPYGWAVAETEV